MKSYSIAVIPGDGTGPEVVREGIKVLEVAAKKYGFSLALTTFDWGGARYLKTGETLPAGAVDGLRKFSAIYLGAIGHPDVKPGILEQGILLALRFALDQYINLRPVKLYPNVETPLANKKPEDIDFVVVRENTEDIYIGAYSAALGRVDAVVFTAGVGERGPVTRAMALEGLGNLGIVVDEGKNAASQTRYAETEITGSGSRVRVFVIPTDEELVMTEDTVALIQGTYDVHTSFTYTFQRPDYVNHERVEALQEDLARNPGLKSIIARRP